MRRLIILAFVSGGLLCAAAASSPVHLIIDPNNPGQPIPPNFSGFSFETGSLRYNHYKTNTYFFDSTNTQLLTLFRNLGIKSMRIGGNSVDRGYIPSRYEIDALFRFVQAAGVKVIYSFRLANGDPRQDASTAKYLWDTYRSWLACLAIGNEPNSYEGLDPAMTNEASFIAKWNTFAAAVTNAVPDVELGGPDNGNGATAWVSAFAEAEKGRGNVVSIFSHYEPGGSSRDKSAQQIMEEMLSPSFNTERYPACYAKIAETAQSNGFSYEFTEANSHVATPASKGVNHSFATALFALDFMHWWSVHGCRALHFHTGLQGFNGSLFAAPNGHYGIHPRDYGVAAYAIGGQGRAGDMAIQNPDNLNLTAYAVTDTNNNLFVTIINKEHGPNARGASVTINARGRSGGVIYLQQSANDITATNGVTLGGVIIDSTRRWRGRWRRVRSTETSGCTVKVGASSAAIVRLAGAEILRR